MFARELTKLFEEIYQCTLAEAPSWVAAGAHREKGEYALLIEGSPTAYNAGDTGCEDHWAKEERAVRQGVAHETRRQSVLIPPCAAMPNPVAVALDDVLSAAGNERGEPDANAPD